MNKIARHNKVLEEIETSLAKKKELEAAYKAESKHLDVLLKEEKDLFQQIQKESLFSSVDKDDTI